jgi:hypothetical protein
MNKISYFSLLIQIYIYMLLSFDIDEISVLKIAIEDLIININKKIK